MITSVDRTVREFHKRAENEEERQRLVNEARVLDVACHPGVVQCLGLEGETLRLRLVDGEALSSRCPDNPVGVAVMAATTLADLHDIGVIHGAVSGDHIVVEAAGTPVLCSFGHGRLAGTGADRADGPEAGTDRADGPVAGTSAAEDVAALARAVLAVGGAELPDAVRELLLSVAEGGPKTPSARRLAGLLATPPMPKRRRCQNSVIYDGVLTPKRRPLLIGGSTALVVGLLVCLAVAAGHHRPVGAVSPCPPADLGCGPVTTGVVRTPRGRYRLGAPGEVIVVGRWTCGGPLPALLEPGTGEVWAWRAWATGKGPVAADFVTRVPGGLTLRVGVGASGCDFLQVLRRRGAAVAVHP